jgi:hypothetical protein
VSKLWDDCGHYVSPHGWTFEVKRWGTTFSITEGRGKRGKKIVVGTARTHDNRTDMCSIYTGDATRRFLGALMEIKTPDDAEAAHASYREELAALGFPAFQMPSLRWETLRGIDLVDYGRPEITGGRAGECVIRCSTLSFTIKDLTCPGENTTIPAVGRSKVKQASALYAELERLTQAERDQLTMRDVDRLMKRAGVIPHSYYAQD